MPSSMRIRNTRYLRRRNYIQAPRCGFYNVWLSCSVRPSQEVDAWPSCSMRPSQEVDAWPSCSMRPSRAAGTVSPTVLLKKQGVSRQKELCRVLPLAFHKQEFFSNASVDQKVSHSTTALTRLNIQCTHTGQLFEGLNIELITGFSVYSNSYRIIKSTLDKK